MKTRLLISFAAAFALSFAAAAVKDRDGCTHQNQWCVCGNTKEAGKCELGPKKEVLFCHCDPPMVHHDGCGKEGQACHCGGAQGPAGSCNLGELKKGLYCQCG